MNATLGRAGFAGPAQQLVGLSPIVLAGASPGTERVVSDAAVPLRSTS